MIGLHTVTGVVMKNYLGSSFTGTLTQNYIVELEKTKVKCIVYTKLSRGLIWKNGQLVKFSARFGSYSQDNIVWCRGVKYES